MNRYEEVTAASGLLLDLAKEHRVMVVGISQLSRASEHGDREPSLADLRESGALEQDADRVLLLYRDDYQKEQGPKSVLTVKVAKNRRGPLGRCHLAYERDCFRVSDPEAVKA